MSETTAIQRTNPGADELNTIDRMAAMLAKSGFAKGARTPEQAAAIILMGREVGIPAMQALSCIHVIEGKPTASAQLIGALLARGGVTWKIERHDDRGCRIVFARKGFDSIASEFTEEDAKRANLLGKGNWRTYPRAMYFARAMTEGARIVGPDLLCGIAYTPEELGATVDGDGNPIEDAPAPRGRAASASGTIDPTDDLPASHGRASATTHDVPLPAAPVTREAASAASGSPPFRLHAEVGAEGQVPPEAGFNVTAARRAAMARCRDLGLDETARRALAVRAGLAPSAKEYGRDEWARFHRALDDEERARANGDARDQGADIADNGIPMPEWAREPGDDAPAPLNRNAAIGDLRAMLARGALKDAGGGPLDEAALANRFGRKITLDACGDDALSRALTWALDTQAAG